MTWVLEPENELIVHAVDYNGARATVQFWIANTEVDPTAGAAAALGAAVQGCTANYVPSVEILRHATWDAAVTPTNGPYARPADKADLTFFGADGSPITIQIPGPNEAILASDHINIDPAQTDVAAFVNYAKTNFKTAEGAAIKGLQRAVRRQPPRLKKH